jgi:serine phosphatase RsbU (regulator of sigma subunit)
MKRLSKPVPTYLRLHTEELPSPAPSDLVAGEGLSQLRLAFEHATGFPLRTAAAGAQEFDLSESASVKPGEGTSPGLIRFDLGPASNSPHLANLESAHDLADAISSIVNRYVAIERALWEREAELAAGVPVVPHRREAEQLARRLHAVLKSGAEAIGCSAAGLYLLDADTTVLKLRSSWGLPQSRLTEPPRRLAGAVADLEALLGNAVVLDDLRIFERWNPPERFAAAVCLPVSSSSTPLGTVWFFAREPRDFNQRETGLLEVVAGRIATELERQMLMVEGMQAARYKRQLAAAERLQSAQVPPYAPLLEGWEVAGWSRPRDAVGGDFADWFLLPDGRMAMAIADAQEPGVSAAILGSALRSAVRSHSQHVASPAAMLPRLNQTVWTQSAGDQHSALWYGVLDPSKNQMQFASAGNVSAWRVRKGHCKQLLRPRAFLGSEPSYRAHPQRLAMQPEDILIVATDGVAERLDERGQRFGLQTLPDLLQAHAREDARTLVEIVRQELLRQAGDDWEDDAALLILKRQRGSVAR